MRVCDQCVFFIVAVATTCALDASEANRQALKLVHDGSIAGALQLFQTASSMDPSNVEYANNAGTAALRLGRHKEARKYLELAASLDPSSLLPKQNLADLEREERTLGITTEPASGQRSRPSVDTLDERRAEDRALAQAAGGRLPPISKSRAPLLSEIADANVPARFRHRIRPIPRLTWKELHEPRHALYRHGHRPFVLVDMFKDHPTWRSRLFESRVARASGNTSGDPFGATEERALPIWDSPAIRVAKDGTVGRFDPRETSVSSPGSGDGAGAGAGVLPVPERGLAGSGQDLFESYGLAGALNTRSTWTLEALIDSFGNRRADAYPHNMEQSSVRPVITTLQEALEELVEPSGTRTRSGVRPQSGYVQWNMAPRDWAAVVRALPGPLPAQFTDDEAWLQACVDDAGPRSEWAPLGPENDLSWDFHVNTHWRMLLIGSWGGGMFGHWDVLATSSWQFHVAGAKRWHICPPSQRRNIGDAGQLDAFNPDYAALPSARKLDCFMDVIIPGEFLYYPRNYWHQTENLVTPTISLTSTIADARNHKGVANEMQRECLGLNRVMSPSKGLCRALSKCFEWWEVGLHGAMVGRNASALGRLVLPVEIATDSKQPMQRVQGAEQASADDAGASVRGAGGAKHSQHGEGFDQSWRRDALGEWPGNRHTCPRQRADPTPHHW